MRTYRLFEKAFAYVYSHRMNAYVEGEALAEIYAHQMKNYCEKRGHAVHLEDVYQYVLENLGQGNPDQKDAA